MNKDAVVDSIVKGRDKVVEISHRAVDRTVHVYDLSKAEQKLKAANPALYEDLPVYLEEVAKVEEPVSLGELLHALDWIKASRLNKS